MTHRPLLLLLLCLLGLTLVACSTGRRGGGGGGGDDDDSATNGPDDDDDDAAPTDSDGDGYPDDEDCDDSDPSIHPGAEEVCGDGLDNDCDELADCDDDNCSWDVASCPPAELAHQAALEFVGTGPFGPVIGDCTTAFTSLLSWDPELDSTCAVCDRVYSGTWDYQIDECTELMAQFEEGLEAPTNGSYGISFIDPNLQAIDVFGLNEDTGSWDVLGTAERWTDDWWELRRDDPVDGPGFGEIGTLSTTLRFQVP